MSDLHCIFDIYHIQKAHYEAFEAPLGSNGLFEIRRQMTSFAKETCGLPSFKSFHCLAVGGFVDLSIISDADETAQKSKEYCLALLEPRSDRGTTRYFIKAIFAEMYKNEEGRWKQPEQYCDGEIVKAIDEAKTGDCIAVSTIDGRDIDGCEDGIAQALGRANLRKVSVFLFTFTPGNRPGERLQRLIADGKVTHIEAEFLREESCPKMRFPQKGNPGKLIPWTLRSLENGRDRALPPIVQREGRGAIEAHLGSLQNRSIQS